MSLENLVVFQLLKEVTILLKVDDITIGREEDYHSQWFLI